MRKRIIYILIPMMVFIGIFLLFRTVFFIGVVPSASMEPTLKENSVVYGLRNFPEPQVGDIIAFEHEGSLLVKRIAAAEGDMVEWRGKGLVVPSGEYFVLGDNEEHSYDSRFWDDPFVQVTDITAKLF